MINETTTEIAPYLFVGNINVISHAGIAQVIRLGIQRVLIVAKLEMDTDLPSKFQALKFAFIDAIDSEEQNILTLFDKTYEFIAEGIKQGQGVVVACEAGISRSITIAAAYLMKVNEWYAYDALEAIKRRRKLAYPNQGFFTQLQLYEKLHYKVNSLDLETKQKMLKYPIQSTFRTI